MSTRERILSVDDNPRNQLILRKLLSSYDLREARTGEEALAEVVRFQPDLILLDIMMPGIDGYETCRRLRAMQSELRSPKIIMVSAKAIVSERLEGYEAGADDYITKPFNPDELLAKVRVYLRLKSMEEMERLRDNIISLLSHETRTPLTGLLAAVEMLRAQAPAEASDPELLDMIDRSARDLHSLIERIVTLSTLRSGTFPFDPQPAALGGLTRDLVVAMRAEAERRGVMLDCVASGDACCRLDARFSDLVIRPLIQNALEHSGPRATVRVEVSDDPDRAAARLVIQDDGPGLDPCLLRNVEQEFVVGDLSHHRRGSGLGLPIARLFTERHGGELRLESEQGAGTRVTLHVPAAAGAFDDDDARPRSAA
jgi:two-component system, sensor histidine kinase and response regulator